MPKRYAVSGYGDGRNRKRKLTMEQAITIRRQYQSQQPRATLRSLAAEYGVHPSTIQSILNYQLYWQGVDRHDS